MATETTKLEATWRRWRGTRQDLVKLAHQAEELALAARAKDPAVHVKIERAQGSSEYVSAAEAAERLPDAPLEGLDSITIRVGSILDDFHVVIYFFKRGTVLQVEGHGDERLAVQGVFEDLRALLESGSRDIRHEFGLALAGTVIGVLLSAGSILGHAVFGGPKWLVWCSYTALPFYAVAWWLFSIRPLFVPYREILGEGDEARSQRWGRRAWKLTGWVVTLVVGGIIGALISKLIG